MSPSITNGWSRDARRPLDEFLDRVDAILKAQGVAREERQTVADELEAQVFTLSVAKSESGGIMTPDIVCRVIETMDPPEAYASAIAQDSPWAVEEQGADVCGARVGVHPCRSTIGATSSGIDPAAIGAAAAGALSMCALVMAIVGRTGPIVGLLGTICVASAVSSIALTFWTMSRIHSSAGALHGLKAAWIARTLRRS